MRRRLWLVLATLLLLPSEAAPRRALPAPLRAFVPFEAAWRGMHAALEQRSIEVLQEDRGKGYIVSNFKEYMSGGLTQRYLAKVGEAQRVSDGDFVKVEFQYEVLLEFVEAQQVLVTVNANIRALKRNFLGEQNWEEIPTIGKLEEDLLTAFGREMFGQSFVLAEPKKGFWERDPTYLPDMSEKIPKIAAPERRP